MELALYLLPVTLGDTPIETVLPPYNKEIILGIRYFIVEDLGKKADQAAVMSMWYTAEVPM